MSDFMRNPKNARPELLLNPNNPTFDIWVKRVSDELLLLGCGSYEDERAVELCRAELNRRAKLN